MGAGAAAELPRSPGQGHAHGHAGRQQHPGCVLARAVSGGLRSKPSDPPKRNEPLRFPSEDEFVLNQGVLQLCSFTAKPTLPKSHPASPCCPPWGCGGPRDVTPPSSGLAPPGDAPRAETTL